MRVFLLLLAAGAADPAVEAPSAARNVHVAGGAERPSAAPAPLEPTADVGAGPNHRPGAPFRSKLSPEGAAGTPLVIAGAVLDADTGRPIAGAVLDAYHADARGHYDSDGFDYRGRIRTDAQGRYEIQTIRPANYGPPPHIHMIVTAEGYVTLRTEIRFTSAEHPTNDRPELTPALVESGSQLRGTFDVVLRRPR